MEKYNIIKLINIKVFFKCYLHIFFTFFKIFRTQLNIKRDIIIEKYNNINIPTFII